MCVCVEGVVGGLGGGLRAKKMVATLQKGLQGNKPFVFAYAQCACGTLRRHREWRIRLDFLASGEA